MEMVRKRKFFTILLLNIAVIITIFVLISCERVLSDDNGIICDFNIVEDFDTLNVGDSFYISYNYNLQECCSAPQIFKIRFSPEISLLNRDTVFTVNFDIQGEGGSILFSVDTCCLVDSYSRTPEKACIELNLQASDGGTEAGDRECFIIRN